ncbi:esterase FE4-like isoform X2 [Anthonomus grandis grandis]|uniref:esterase FE4-like isoform X2 n=1 Tax=Anthonomus grandis grandis TaxID=2921223 RepID=UPI00216562B5|nr:esterase FE4-like isoform X2 [Anthonomus grandis grandis]
MPQFWLFFIFFGCYAKRNSENVQIKLKSGILQGNIKPLDNGQTYYNFQGIPYALPPVGKLRFSDPIPFKKWNGILNATSPGPNCVQLLMKQTKFSVAGQEDCLYLNVFTPQNPHTIEKPLAVMVWFYGGSFREGSADIYSPDYFMQENNVVIVTFNYRLGFFGFLSTEDDYAPGNYGMKDMVLALKWVQRNIHKFGGDKNRVTIFGESAGAAAVGYLMLSNQSKGLFYGAVMQSGSPLCSWALHRNARKVAFDLGAALGLTTNNSATLVNYLRSVDLPRAGQAIINVNLVNFVTSFENGGPFGPVIEPPTKDAFLTVQSFKAFQSGSFNRVPVMMGVNSQESKFFTPMLKISLPVFIYNDLSPSSLARGYMNVRNYRDRREIGQRIKQRYFKSNSFAQASKAELVEFFSDDLFVKPISKTAQLLSNYVPVYFYVFDYEGPMAKTWMNFISEDNKEMKGTAHAVELWYMWKPLWTNQRLNGQEEQLVSRRLVKLWTNFATQSNPTPTKDSLFKNSVWPKVSPPDVNYFWIGKGIETRKNFKAKNMQFWESLYGNFSSGPTILY